MSLRRARERERKGRRKFSGGAGGGGCEWGRTGGGRREFHGYVKCRREGWTYQSLIK